MTYMVRLWWLLVAHAITDALLQDPQVTSIGRMKHPDNRTPGVEGHWPYWMFLHGVINGLGVYAVTGNLTCMVGEVIFHSFIDYGKCKHWYGVHYDQTLHVWTKLVWVWVSLP